jgi:uncharacterized membrane protein
MMPFRAPEQDPLPVGDAPSLVVASEPRRDARVAVPAVLLGLVVLGAILRWTLMDKGLWFDEIGEVVAARSSLPDLLSLVRSHAAAAPLDYLGTKIAMAAWSDPTIGPRLWSMAMGLLAIPLMYCTSLSLFQDRRAGIVSAAAIAVSPFAIYFSSDARFYSLIVVATLANLWALGWLADRPSRVRWLVWGTTVVMAFYTHYPLLGLIAVETVYLALVMRRSWRLLATTLFLASLACLPWAVYAVRAQVAVQYSGGYIPFTQGLLKTILGELLAPGADRAAEVGGPTMLGPLPIVAIVLITAAAGTILLLKSKRLIALVPLTWAAAVIPLQWFADNGAHYFFQAKQVIVLLPLLLLLAGVAVARASRRSRGLTALGCLATLVLLVPSLVAVTNDRYMYRDGWREASAWLVANTDKDTRIGSAVTADWDYGVAYYAPQLLPQISSLADFSTVDVVVTLGDWEGRPPTSVDGWTARNFGGSVWILVRVQTLKSP